MIKPRDFATALETRVFNRIKSLSGDDIQRSRALFKIGIILEAEIKRNIVSRRLVDTGSLLNSIRYEVISSEQKVRVGSFGIPYAAVHEFGYNGQVTIRSHTRLGRPVRQHQRQVNIPRRSYLQPAIVSKTQEIVRILKEEL